MSARMQGCQMVYLQTKSPTWGKIWRALEWKMLLYLMTIWNMFRSFGMIHSRLVYFTRFGPRKIWQRSRMYLGRFLATQIKDFFLPLFYFPPTPTYN
jgi:hypothetical protein